MRLAQERITTMCIRSLLFHLQLQHEAVSSAVSSLIH